MSCKAGGSAVDAAIAANATLGLMEPTGNGVGGDLFAIVWSATDRKLYRSQRLPAGPRAGLSREQLMADLNKLGRDTIPQRGFLPISVPGAVDGWFELARPDFGKLPMKDVLAPAIRYAKERLPRHRNSSPTAGQPASATRRPTEFPGAFLATYAPNGRAPTEGEIFRTRTSPTR